MISQLDSQIRRFERAILWRLRCQWASFNAVRTSVGVLDSSRHRRLLVVCHGNIFRSPLAAELLRAKLTALSEVRSAGFHPVAGRKPPPECVAICARLGIDVAQHRSRLLSLADIDWADTVVIMDRHNWRHLKELGVRGEKVVWLGAMDRAGDIRDPYGLPARDAEAAMRRVHACATELGNDLFPRLKSPAG